jgi:molecular chaperone DnaJ
MAARRDLYEVLGVDRNASQEEIRRAFRRLARRYHPDVSPEDPEAEARFKELSAAYQVLSDPDRRAHYDRYGEAGPADLATADIWEELGLGGVFDAFFGRPGRTRTRAQARQALRRGADLQTTLEITLEEVASGAERSVEAERLSACADCGGTGSRSKAGEKTCPACGGSGEARYTTDTFFGLFSSVTSCRQCGGQGSVLSDPCPKCRGVGRRPVHVKVPVSIPPGAEDGTTLKIVGEGEAGVRGGPAGDLYVVLRVKPHGVFERHGRDLMCEVPVPFTVAALGGSVSVPTLDGKGELKVPAGTQTGERLTLHHMGLPDARTGVRGNLHFVAKVTVPTKLTKRQRQLLEEFRQEER